MNELRNPFLRWVLITAGCICVGLGVIGIFVPILPTTPFLLLAAACFIRSSSKMYEWMLTNRLFGKHLRSYMDGEGVSIKVKIGTLSFLWIAILSSFFFFTDNLIIRLILLFIAISVTAHIMYIKTSG